MAVGSGQLAGSWQLAVGGASSRSERGCGGQDTGVTQSILVHGQCCYIGEQSWTRAASGIGDGRVRLWGDDRCSASTVWPSSTSASHVPTASSAPTMDDGSVGSATFAAAQD
jgi:hypothetical protein